MAERGFPIRVEMRVAKVMVGEEMDLEGVAMMAASVVSCLDGWMVVIHWW